MPPAIVPRARRGAKIPVCQYSCNKLRCALRNRFRKTVLAIETVHRYIAPLDFGGGWQFGR
jgi:hypothetical protein